MSIKIKGLNLSIDEHKNNQYQNTKEKIICHNLNIEFKTGEFWGILGVNGVGKSTLLHHLINIDTTHHRCISIDNTYIEEYSKNRKILARKTGLLLQEYEYNFPCSVLEAALIGRHPHLSYWQWEDQQDIKIARQALSITNLLALKDRNISTLSGGEKRRLNIATILTQNPQFFLLDEPTNHLDLKSQTQILSLFKQKIKEEKKTAIMVIHDANLAYQYCDKVLLLYGDGEWSAGNTKEEITTSNLNKVYDCTFQTFHNGSEILFSPSII